MLAFDIIGLLITVVVVGPRYAHYILVAAMLGEVGRILISVFMEAEIISVVAGGIFSSTAAQGIDGTLSSLLVYFSGALCNYFIGASFGGIENEKLSTLLNPFQVLKHPFAVVNIRLAIFSGLYSGWHYFFH